MAKPKIEIIVSADVQGATNALDKVALQADKVDRAGRRAMMGLRAVGEAGQLIGAGEAFREMASNAAMAADVVGDLSGAFLTLNPATLALTAIAAGTVFLAAKLTETTPQVAALNQELSSLARRQDAVRGLAELAGATDRQAEAALSAARVNAEYAKALDNLSKKTQRDVPQALKETIGAYVALAAVVGEYIATQGDQEAALMSGQKMLKMIAPEIWQRVEAQEELNRKVAEGSNIIEQTRLTDLYKRSIIQAAEEQERFVESIARLDAGLEQSLAKLEQQYAEAQRRAGLDRIRIEQDTAERLGEINMQLVERINSIQENLAQQIGDIEEQANQAKSDAYERYARDIQELNRDMTRIGEEYARRRIEIEKDTSDEIERINAELADTLQNISRDAAQSEATAKTWAEVQRIRREAAAREREAADKAARARAEAEAKKRAALEELEERKRQQDEEFRHRRELLDEEYNRQNTIRDRELREQIARAQRAANEQIEQARRTATEQQRQIEQTMQKQLEAINQQLSEQRRAINIQRDEQIAAVQTAKDAETRAYEKRMRELQDTRNENQHLADAMIALAGPAWDPWLEKAREYIDVVNSIPTPPSPPSLNWQNWLQGYRPAGWYASGLDTVITRPTLIGVGESGAEHVTITPLRGGAERNQKSIARTIQFYNCQFRSADDIYAALERYERGLI